MAMALLPSSPSSASCSRNSCAATETDETSDVTVSSSPTAATEFTSTAQRSNSSSIQEQQSKQSSACNNNSMQSSSSVAALPRLMPPMLSRPHIKYVILLEKLTRWEVLCKQAQSSSEITQMRSLFPGMFGTYIAHTVAINHIVHLLRNVYGLRVCHLKAQTPHRNLTLENIDAIIAAGGDGTFLEATSLISASKYHQMVESEKKQIWVFGINTDPSRSEGNLLMKPHQNMKNNECVYETIRRKTSCCGTRPTHIDDTSEVDNNYTNPTAPSSCEFLKMPLRRSGTKVEIPPQEASSIGTFQLDTTQQQRSKKLSGHICETLELLDHAVDRIVQGNYEPLQRRRIRVTLIDPELSIADKSAGTLRFPGTLSRTTSKTRRSFMDKHNNGNTGVDSKSEEKNRLLTKSMNQSSTNPSVSKTLDKSKSAIGINVLKNEVTAAAATPEAELTYNNAPAIDGLDNVDIIASAENDSYLEDNSIVYDNYSDFPTEKINKIPSTVSRILATDHNITQEENDDVTTFSDTEICNVAQRQHHFELCKDEKDLTVQHIDKKDGNHSLSRWSQEQQQPPQKKMIEYLAVNDVLVTSQQSHMSFYVEWSVNKSKPQRSKNSGVIVCTGSGSSAWAYNVSKISEATVQSIIDQFVQQQPPTVQRNLISADSSRICRVSNSSLLFDPSEPKMRLVIREPIDNRVFATKQPSVFGTKITLRPLTQDAVICLDGICIVPVQFGQTIVLEIDKPEDSLLTGV